MAFNQMNDNLNDAFETYFPNNGTFIKVINKSLEYILIYLMKIKRIVFHGQVKVNERIIEYPQIMRLINPNAKILDIGCVSSRLPIQLASLGHEVHGLDTRHYPFTHPNCTFHCCDLFKWEPTEQFDTILLVSALEHFGIGGYGDLILEDADKQAIEKIYTWLHDNGQLLLSVPFGKPAVTKKHRIYDINRLKKLFNKFKWINQYYYKRVNENWFPCNHEELENIASLNLPPNGVSILHLQKSV